MNFLEAVQALEDGLCEGIAPVKANWCKYALNDTKHLVFKLDGCGIKTSLKMFLGDWQLINPVKQYREEEVVAYLNNKTNDLITGNDPNRPVHDPKIWTKLTGVRRVEVKPKIRKRREVKQFEIFDNIITPDDYKLYIEWYEDADQSGKE